MDNSIVDVAIKTLRFVAKEIWEVVKEQEYAWRYLIINVCVKSWFIIWAYMRDAFRSQRPLKVIGQFNRSDFLRYNDIVAASDFSEEAFRERLRGASVSDPLWLVAFFTSLAADMGVCDLNRLLEEVVDVTFWGSDKTFIMIDIRSAGTFPPGMHELLFRYSMDRGCFRQGRALSALGLRHNGVMAP